MAATHKDAAASSGFHMMLKMERTAKTRLRNCHSGMSDSEFKRLGEG